MILLVSSLLCLSSRHLFQLVSQWLRFVNITVVAKVTVKAHGSINARVAVKKSTRLALSFGMESGPNGPVGVFFVKLGLFFYGDVARW